MVYPGVTVSYIQDIENDIPEIFNSKFISNVDLDDHDVEQTMRKQRLLHMP
jgi:hypothetical protein